jgi:hypothetical protein
LRDVINTKGAFPPDAAAAKLPLSFIVSLLSDGEPPMPSSASSLPSVCLQSGVANLPWSMRAQSN